MKLEGFRCDECGTESRTTRGRWVAVQSLNIEPAALGHGWSALSEPLHYCSKDCLLAAIPKWLAK